MDFGRVMKGPLPTGWISAVFTDVASARMGKTILSKDLKPSGLPVFSAATENAVWGYTDDESVAYERGTIVISARGTIGAAKLPNFDRFVSTQTTIAATPNSMIDPKFLMFQITGLQWAEFTSTTAIPMLTISALSTVPVSIAPFNEQVRIVEKIETLFAQLDKGEEAVREVQKLLARYRQSVLKAAVTGQLTADWRAERTGQLEHGRDLLARILAARRDEWQGRGSYKEPVEPVASDLPDLPAGWVWASVDQILRAGLSNGKSVPDAEGVGFPVMRLTALKEGVIDISERKTGRWTASEAAPFLIEQGDILVSRGNGSKTLVGRGGLVADDVDPVAYPDTMIRIPISLQFLSPNWFVQLWNSPWMRGQIEKAAKTTAGIYKINQGDIRSFAVPLAPMDEQEEVASLVAGFVEKTNVLETWCATELKRSASLRQSILKEAFAGRLVPQDPADEPASALLARIAAGKTSTKKPPRKTIT